jgi:hypothetical protein
MLFNFVLYEAALWNQFQHNISWEKLRKHLFWLGSASGSRSRQTGMSDPDPDKNRRIRNRGATKLHSLCKIWMPYAVQL